MPLVAPSLLSANFGALDKDIDMINQSEADWFHLDIMDGVFVPNLSFGFPVIKSIQKNAKKPLDVHLMIIKPDRYLEEFKNHGAEWLTIHYESVDHLHRTIQQIKSLGMKAGVSLNPHTPVHFLVEIITDLDLVLLMSVNPGFGGQKFIPGSVDKVKKLKELIEMKNSHALIEVDGGVDLHNAGELVKAGADVLVAGNSVFKAPNPLEVIRKLKNTEK